MSATPTSRTALIMAGGTGGHIFPGLAVADALRNAGWRVVWLGGRGTATSPSMESQLVPPKGFVFESIEFSGVRGKSRLTQMQLPFRLLRACWQSLAVLRRIKPDAVLAFGGYISVPAGLMSVVLRKPLIVHEQNSVAGSANKLLARFADKIYTAFPAAFPEAVKAARWVGNPLRSAFLNIAEPSIRYAKRHGPLRILVMGGSLGAKALNDIVPKALALMPVESRPLVKHQSGQKQIDELRANYNTVGVQAELTPFIDDTASAFADADLVICRAGASTVTEIAAVGAAAVFVPLPSAIDDHQTGNARFLVDQNAGWLVTQQDLTADRLARMLTKADRPTLMAAAIAARKMAKPGATERIVAACEKLTAKRNKA
jgi:UDP-N-acetylglucosamine--N-acetylmuramyl-(pentapeptide) pyrophosphoryl-undecaprenol N-acetylglucosamine transferase